MGSPASSSTSGQPQGAQAYVPQNQPGFDQALQALMSTMYGQATSGLGVLSQPPGSTAYPGVLGAYENTLNNPYNPQLQQGANTIGSMGPGVGQSMVGLGGQLAGYGTQVANTGFDPQQQLYNQLQQQTVDQSQAANAAAGLGSSPYGAGTTNQALQNFNISWQNQQLQNQLQGLAGAEGAYQTGTGLQTAGLNTIQQSSAAPAQAYAGIQNQVFPAAQSLTGIGNQVYALPQQLINNIQSYLGLGQSAASLSGQLGQEGQNELTQTLGGIGSLAGGVGLGATGLSGLGGLAAAGNGANAGGILSALPFVGS